ncbi:hypothetical protein [Sphingopyxis sp.]|uniref:hypothetical protein n=1 Tax=Sphingopyxis sp. TaxID=1908224 RepID=UPI0040367DD6
MNIFGFLLALFVAFGLFFLWLEVKAPPRGPAVRPAPPPPLRVPPMTGAARIVIPLMRSGPAIPARSIATVSGLPVSGVLAAQRELRAIGLAAYGPAANDNGKFAGSGYSLTDAGLELQQRLADAA